MSSPLSKAPSSLKEKLARKKAAAAALEGEPPEKRPARGGGTTSGGGAAAHRLVWVRDADEAWIPGAVERERVDGGGNEEEKTRRIAVATDKDAAPRVFTVDDATGESEDVKTRNVFEDAEVRGYQDVNDLTRLTHLHEPEILQALTVRYNANIIYTNTGPILIAVNPFKPLSIYTGEHIARYYTTGLADAQEASQLPPHVFSVADAAFRNLQDLKGEGKMNQSILVSGESGAGKTETTKFVMSYLATVARSDSSTTSASKMETGVADRILESNPILESFGNARTIRNDNSSRFGKFIQMNFDSSGGNPVLVGAQILTYLLEKVRLVGQQPGERNFHVFYQMCRGASEEETKRWMLPDVEQSRFTSSSGVFDRRDGVRDEDQFARTEKAFATMKFTPEEREDIYVVTSAVLNLGDVSFVANTTSSSTGGDASSQVEPNNPALQAVCALLQVEPEAFGTAMTTRTISTHGESYVKGLDVEAAGNARDALAKTVYSRLFDFIVKRVNQAVAQTSSTAPTPKKQPSSSSTTATNFIAVLDIFGFEVFKHNSFEQLCINYANETLQQQFNQFVFKLEQQEYEREAIQWSFIEFPDNQPTLDLIEAKPTGLLALLDEQCLFPQGNDEALARKFYDVFKDSPLLTASKADRVEFRFVVKHYAGDVAYSSKGFCAKNKDELREEALSLMHGSKSPFVRDVLFPASLTQQQQQDFDKKKRTSGSIQAETLGSQFKSQLASLLKTIRSTSPHYVRCLKPNDENVPDLIMRPRLVDQLRYGGVLEAVKVARAGYPTRYLVKDFVRRYSMLGTAGTRLKDTPESCDAVFASLQLSRLTDYQIGKTKIFMRKSAFEVLEDRRSAKLKAAAGRIQAVARGVLARRRYRVLCRSALTAQRVVRGFLGRCRARHAREEKAAVLLQAVARMHLARAQVRDLRRGAVLAQSLFRRLRARREVEELRRFVRARTLQCFFRRSRARRAFLQQQKEAIVLQTAWRAVSARLLLKRLRVEAKEVGNLQAKLEEKDRLIAELRVAAAAAGGVTAASASAGPQRDALEKLSFELLAAKAEAERLAQERDQVKVFLEQLQSATASVDVATVKEDDAGNQAMMIRDLQRLLAQSQEEMRAVAAERDSLAALSLSHEHPATREREDQAEVEARMQELRDELVKARMDLAAVTAERDDLRMLTSATAQGGDVNVALENLLKTARAETVQLTLERDEARQELMEMRRLWDTSKALAADLNRQLDEARAEVVSIAAERDSLSAILATAEGVEPSSPSQHRGPQVAELKRRVEELEAALAAAQGAAPVVVLQDGTRAVTRESYMDVVNERDRLALLLAQQERKPEPRSGPAAGVPPVLTGAAAAAALAAATTASSSSRQDLLTNRIRELEMEVQNFQVHKNQIIENLMQATNDSNQKDIEIRALKRVQVDLQEKLAAMEQLAEQTSGVKIALARRLEGLIIENRTMKQSMQEAQEQLAATQDISRILNAELEQKMIALEAERLASAKLRAVLENGKVMEGEDETVVTL